MKKTNQEKIQETNSILIELDHIENTIKKIKEELTNDLYELEKKEIDKIVAKE